MAQFTINIPGLGDLEGDRPIVILGPNGSGKTQLAKKIAARGSVTAISAQRRTWLDDTLPVEDAERLRTHVQNQQSQWQNRSWHPTEEINHVLSTLIQEHTSALTTRNEEARATNVALPPLNDGRLIQLQDLWGRLFPLRKLDIGGFFPRVRRLDAGSSSALYSPRDMSDGERTILYMAARILTAEHPVLLIDEPELHMHSRLAISFWDEAERLRPDRRFIYITHDLNFTLSRRRATVLLARSASDAVRLSVEELPASIAPEVLGAATLPFYAKRVCLYEGETGKGFASDFFPAWFDGDETFAIACGGRDSVFAAVSGLKAVGVSGAAVIGLVDRDFYSDEHLSAIPSGVAVLAVHEIESVLCTPPVVEALAAHLGRPSAWDGFVSRVRSQYTGTTLSSVIARRVRARTNDLLDGAFSGSQVLATVASTRDKHRADLTSLDIPAKVEQMFVDEEARVVTALASGDADLVALLPGKHLLSLLAAELGLDHASDLASLAIAAVDRTTSKIAALSDLGAKLEAALLLLLPPRRVV